jgi:hypothetical protein
VIFNTLPVRQRNVFVTDGTRSAPDRKLEKRPGLTTMAGRAGTAVVGPTRGKPQQGKANGWDASTRRPAASRGNLPAISPCAGTLTCGARHLAQTGSAPATTHTVSGSSSGASASRGSYVHAGCSQTMGRAGEFVSCLIVCIRGRLTYGSGRVVSVHGERRICSGALSVCTRKSN